MRNTFSCSIIAVTILLIAKVASGEEVIQLGAEAGKPAGSRVTAGAQPRSDENSNFRSSHRSFFQLLNSGRPEMEASYLLQPGNDPKDGPGGFDLQQFTAKFDLPTPITNELFLRFGAEYSPRLVNFDTVKDSRTSTSDTTYHKVSGAFGGGLFITDDFLLTGAFRPGIYSDWNNGLKSDDLRYFGDGLAAFRFNPGAMLVGGVMVSEVWNDDLVLPLFGFRMQSEDGVFRVSATFPLEATLQYYFNPGLFTYGGFWVDGDEFHATSGPSSVSYNVQVHDQRGGIGVGYWIDQHFMVGAEGGVSAGSELKFKSSDAGQFEDGDLDTAGYFKVLFGIGM